MSRGRNTSPQIKNKAFTMYCLAIPHKVISKQLDIPINTIGKWITREKWIEDRQKMDNLNREVAQLSVNERQKKLVVSIQENFAEKLDKGQGKVQARDALDAVKTERLIDDLSTENLALAIKSNPFDVYAEELTRRRNKQISKPVSRESKETS